MTRITLAKGGTAERVVDIKELQVPDLWHIGMELKDGCTGPCAGDRVLECWHLCHDLLRHIRDTESLAYGLGHTDPADAPQAPHDYQS